MDSEYIWIDVIENSQKILEEDVYMIVCDPDVFEKIKTDPKTDPKNDAPRKISHKKY